MGVTRRHQTAPDKERSSSQRQRLWHQPPLHPHLHLINADGYVTAPWVAPAHCGGMGYSHLCQSCLGSSSTFPLLQMQDPLNFPGSPSPYTHHIHAHAAQQYTHMHQPMCAHTPQPHTATYVHTCSSHVHTPTHVHTQPCIHMLYTYSTDINAYTAQTCTHPLQSYIYTLCMHMHTYTPPTIAL